MTFKVNIDTDNSAFEGPMYNYELGRLLRQLAKRVEDGEDFGLYRNILDANGNIVGRAKEDSDPNTRKDT